MWKHSCQLPTLALLDGCWVDFSFLSAEAGHYHAALISSVEIWSQCFLNTERMRLAPACAVGSGVRGGQLGGGSSQHREGHWPLGTASWASFERRREQGLSLPVQEP